MTTNDTSTQCPPGIATMLTLISREAVFTISATVVGICDGGSLLCTSQTGLDILDQEMIHLKHVRPVRLDVTKIAAGTPILLQSNKRAEVVDVDKKKVYLHDEGRFEFLSDWSHYFLPKTLLEIPAQVFEVQLNDPHYLNVGDEVNLLVFATNVSKNAGRCDSIVYRASLLEYTD
ncbi:uncharacterized protein LOC100897144 [Galendromus occidentalis]|uniref:Uncharacterized protein LOC100897144 n=1 Tax=Galendromus occidentalis TaxID=34638 RepID=A0AAJ6QMR0_9ACAR|nr:uncharacterized protein LOC100897144 [Galendromus occidentalis]